MKILICLLIFLTSIMPVNASSLLETTTFNVEIIQDETSNNIMITSSNLDYLKAIESVEFFDGESTITIEIEKQFNESFNAFINEKSKTLIIYFSTLNNISNGSYQIYLNANGYEKTRADEYGCVINKKIIEVPGDVLVIKDEEGLKIKSKEYSFIHGLQLEYNKTLASETYNYIQFSKSQSFDDAITYENVYAKLPFSDIKIVDEYFVITIPNDRMKSMGFEEDEVYYVQLQSACFKEKTFGSFILVEKEEIDEKPIDTNDSNITLDKDDDKVNNKQELNIDEILDKILYISIIVSIVLLGLIVYLVYKRKNKN